MISFIVSEVYHVEDGDNKVWLVMVDMRNASVYKRPSAEGRCGALIDNFSALCLRLLHA